MELSVIILNYNVCYFLEQCVWSVQKALQHIDGEIIVVDNNSSDASCQMIQEQFPTVKLIQNKENLGFSKGNNIGVAAAKGKLICILNPDTVVAEDTFQIMLSEYKSRACEVGIMGCKLIDGTGHFLPESKRGVPTPWVAFTKIFGLYKWFKHSRLFNAYYAQHITENQSGAVEILVGAFMMLERKLYLKIGGFDENCFMYSDDIDLSYMVLKTGKINYYIHKTSIIHYKGESTIRNKHYMKRFKDAMVFFYQKHFKSNKSKFSLFVIFMHIGTFYFSLIKKNQVPTKKKNPEEYVIFSNKNLNLKRGKKITYLTNFNQFTNNPNSRIEIFFDTQCFTFKEIINFMELQKASNITFKNYIGQSNYFIGSNYSNDKGEVLFEN